MTTATSLYYYNDQLGKVDPRKTDFWYTITGAKGNTAVVANSAQINGYDAAAPFATQAAIDAFLGTSSEFLLAAFDSTSMGTDAFAVIVNMGGQAKVLVAAQITSYTGTGGTTVASLTVPATAAGLTASSLSTQAALGSSGNLAFRSVLSGMDGFTSGLIRVTFEWISK